MEAINLWGQRRQHHTWGPYLHTATLVGSLALHSLLTTTRHGSAPPINKVKANILVILNDDY